MKHWHNELNFTNTTALTDSIFSESSVFFDIETTGFSPVNTSLYLIGCASRKGTTLFLDQFFAENPSEEKEVLSAFLQHISSYQTILSFNGLGFDIPYLKGKCKTYEISDPFGSYDYVDIFKEVSRLKFLLKLENYKQKSIEKFLGIGRDDQFDGGQLIDVYQDYVKHPTDDAEHFLKLHNYEDVLGMTDLLSILSYSRFFHGDFSLQNICTKTYENFDHTETGEELFFSLALDFPVPRKVSYRFEDCYLHLADDTATISVKIKNDTLKFFFPNYKDYFYLPDEDTAIHKSVAAFVDKEYRQKAKAANCYQKKTGRFLPQYDEWITPAFRREHKDKISYFELTEDFLASETMLASYLKNLVHTFSIQKK